MFPGLNVPQQVQPVPGGSGGVVGPNPSALNRRPQAEQIVQGMQQLMQGLVTSKQAVEQHYGQKVDDLATRAANGLITPDAINWKEVASWMKKSNRGYNTDLTPAELQAQLNQQKVQQFQNAAAAGQQGAQQMASQASGMPPLSPGPMGSPGQPGVAAPGVVAPPMPAQAPPGFMDRLRMMMNGQQQMGAQPSAMSPAVQGMQALAAAGQAGGGAPGMVARGMQDSVLASNVKRAAGQLGIAHDQTMAPVYSQLFQKALNGDMPSMTMLRRLDIMKGVPIDEVASLYQAENPGAPPAAANAQAAKLLLWQQGGGPQLQLKIADLAKDMVPRFGGDAQAAMQYTQGLYTGQNTGLHPGLTPEEFGKKTDAESKIVERYPAAPVGLAKMYGDAEMAGKTDLSSNILDFLSSHYKSGGQISQSQFQQTLSKDYAQIASQNEVGNRDADNGQLRAYTDSIETLLKNTGYEDMQKNPEGYTQDARMGAAKRVNDLVNSLAGQQVEIKGKKQQLAPYQDLTSRNNITRQWWQIPYTPLGMGAHGPYLQGNVQPSFGPAAGGVQGGGGYQSMSPGDQQLLGNPFGSPAPLPNNIGGLQQLLMQRAQQ